ncbi:MAG: sugar-binding protein [Candidatus Latescibacterota bacterium]
MSRAVGRARWVVGMVGILCCDAQAELAGPGIHAAFQFPDSLVPQIDGRLEDWELLDEGYIIPTEVLHDLVNDQAGRASADFACRLMVGWNATLNQLYVAAEVQDDVHQVDRPAGTAAVRIFQDDCMEVFLDADHSGGQYADFSDLGPQEQLRRNGSEASHFVLAGPPPDGDFFVNFSAAAWYALPDGPYTRAAYALEPGDAGGTVMRYELMLVPFDRVDMDAVFLSDEHRMREGEILGFNVELDDYDASSTLLDAKWSLSGQHNAFRFSERFADLLLMPQEDMFTTGVEALSWGRVKASWRP